MWPLIPPFLITLPARTQQECDHDHGEGHHHHHNRDHVHGLQPTRVPEHLVLCKWLSGETGAEHSAGTGGGIAGKTKKKRKKRNRNKKGVEVAPTENGKGNVTRS